MYFEYKKRTTFQQGFDCFQHGALGSGTVGFFANHITELYGCILFGIGVALMVYSIANLNK